MLTYQTCTYKLKIPNFTFREMQKIWINGTM